DLADLVEHEADQRLQDELPAPQRGLGAQAAGHEQRGPDEHGHHDPGVDERGAHRQRPDGEDDDLVGGEGHGALSRPAPDAGAWAPVPEPTPDPPRPSGGRAAGRRPTTARVTSGRAATKPTTAPSR